MYLLLQFLSILFAALFVAEADGGERHIAITSHKAWKGEHSLAHRIQHAADRLGWKADLRAGEAVQEIYSKEYDFVIHLVPGVALHPTAKNYLAIFDPYNHYFESSGYLKMEYRFYDGYLLTYEPGVGDKNFSNRYSPPHLRWYPTVYDVAYKKVNPKYLFYICSTWGNRRNDSRYQTLLNFLEKGGYARFYGDVKVGEQYPKSFKGPIPFMGDHLYKAIQEAGIYLLLHSEFHLKYGLPSGRIFEAAASSAVILSDNNAFIKEHFGDSVLYIDVDASGESMFEQVERHMRWIRLHKKQAARMAKRSHAIFKEKFLLEMQMVRLGEFHDRIKGSTRVKVPEFSTTFETF